MKPVDRRQDGVVLLQGKLLLSSRCQVPNLQAKHKGHAAGRNSTHKVGAAKDSQPPTLLVSKRGLVARMQARAETSKQTSRSWKVTKQNSQRRGWIDTAQGIGFRLAATGEQQPFPADRHHV